MFAEVALPIPVRHRFTYSVPRALEARIRRGLLVLVPVMRRTVTGVVLDIAESTPLRQEGIKPIKDVFFPETCVPETVLALAVWASEYYIEPPGEMIRCALPPGLGASSRLVAVLAGGTVPQDSALSPEERELLTEIRSRQGQLVASLRRRFPAARFSLALKSLESKGVVRLEEKIRRPSMKPQFERTYFAADGDPNVLLQACGRSMRKAAVLRYLLAHPSGVLHADLRLVAGGDSGVLKSLVRDGVIRFTEMEIFRDPFSGADGPDSFSLNPEQKAALESVEGALAEGQFRPFLLFGVTGSGKTAIYTEAIAQVLAGGGGAIYLVPEIALTPLLARKLKGLFGDAVSLLHSGLRSTERYDEWRRVREGRARVVLGARSAVFAPVHPLKLIVVDEEHDPAYKQDDSPRYNARDLAILRAKMEGASVILGSATPSMESYEKALKGKYRLLRLTSRVEERAFAEVEVVDMTMEFRTRGRSPILSERLEQAVGERLGMGEQVILLLNRRGYANYLLCRQCGAAAECPRCSVALTYHASEKRLKCHYCGFRRLPPPQCPKCGGDFLEFVGYGTEKVEDVLREKFPGVAVRRLDRDVVRTREDYEGTLIDFREGKIQVILGTQMVAKGHDFPGVTLVGVISVDAGLGIPDFRISERTFQILTQVSGRAGRGPAGGQVIYQTFHPENYAIRFAEAQDFEGFFDHERRFRRLMRYPPFANLIHLVVKGNSEQQVRMDARKLAGRLGKEGKGFQLLGPAPAPFARLKGKYRYQIILKGNDRVRMRTAVLQALEALRGGIDLKRIEIDVDPMTML
jgi:primosomal protein N' (replication factor Y)